MADLEELLISVNSELGDLSGIDSAVKALEGLKSFSNDAKRSADSLDKMANALSQFNSYGKSKTNTSKIVNDITKLTGSLESLSKFSSDASKSIKQLENLGKALGSFANIGKNLAGINDVTKGVEKMVNVLDKLSQVEKDSTKGISGLRNLGKALHSFNGLDDNAKSLNDVALGIMNLSKATDMLSQQKGGSFKYLTTLGDSLKSFSENMGGTTRIWTTIGNVTNGITGLITALKDTKSVDVGNIGAIANEIKKFGDASIIANARNVERSLGVITSTLNALNNSSGLVHNTMDKVINGFERADRGFYNIRTSIEAVATDFNDALKPIQNSNLFEMLERFKHLNDSYKNVGGLGQGLGVLITALDNLGGRDLDTYGITQILEFFSKLSKESYVDEAVKQMEKVGNLAQPIASLVNALKYTDFDDKNNVLTVLGKQINIFYQSLPDNFDKFSFVMYGLRDVINLAKDLSISIPKDNVITQLGASLSSLKGIENGKSLTNLLAGIKSIGEWLSPTLREGASEAKSQLSVYENAIESLREKIASMNSEKNNLIKERDTKGDEGGVYTTQIAKLEAGLKTYESLLRQQEAKKRELEASFSSNNIDTTPIEKIATSLSKFSDVGNNLNAFKTMVNNLKGLKEINVNNLNGVELVLEGLFETLNKIPDGKVGALKDLGSVTRAINKLQNVEPAQLNLIADALSRIFNALGSIQGSNNKIQIRLDSSGITHFNEVIEKTKTDYTEFATTLDEALENIDFSSVFNVDAPIKSLRQQLREAERMLHSTIKNMEQERQKIDRSNVTGARNDVVEKQIVKYKQLQEQAEKLRQVIEDLHVSIANAPKFETDKEGYQYIRNLKEELTGLQAFMKRFNRQGLTESTTELGQGFKNVQDRIVAIQDEIRKAESDLQSMEETEEGLIYRTSEFVNEMTRLADEAERASSEMRKGIGEGFSKFSGILKGSKNPVLGSVGNLTDMFGKAVQNGTAQLNASQLASLTRLAEKLGTLATAIAQVSAVLAVVISLFKAWWGLLNKIREALTKFVQQAMQFAKSMLQHIVGAFNAVAGAVDKVVATVKSGAELLGTALRKVGDFGKNIINVFRRVGQAVPVALKGVKAVLTAVTPNFVKTLVSSNFNLSKIIKNTHLLKNAIKSVTRYFSMLTRMLMRKSITAFLNEMKQAFEDMVLFEKNAGDAMLNLNTNVSKMFSEMRRSANQWIAVFEPLINAVTPTVVGFFANLQAMGENLARFMAILTGQPYYLRAKRFYEDYGDNVDKTRKKVKDLTNGLDELNILNDSSSSSETDGILPEDMFEKVLVDGSFDGIKVNIKDLIDQIVDWLQNIDWQAIKDKVREIIHRLMEIINEILARLDLWEWLGKTLAELFNTVMDAWNQFITDFDPKATADAISTFIINALNGIDWDLINQNVELTAQKFAQFWNEVFANDELWNSITTAITNFLNEIVHYFDTWAWTFDFEGLASRITSALTNILTGFDYEQLRHAVEGWVTGFADFVNKIASDKQFWRTLGDSIAKIINATIIEAFGDLAKINFTELTDSLKIAIENALTGINWDKYLEDMKKWGENLADIVNGLFGDAGFLTTITTSFANFANGFIGLFDKFLTDLKAYDIGLAISNAFAGLGNINWDTLFALPAKAINAFSNAIRGLLDGLPEDFNLGTWLTNHLTVTMQDINWDELKKNLNDLSVKINEWLNGILQNEEFWTTAGATTGHIIDIGINFLFNLVNFKGEDLGTAIKNYVNGLIGKVNIGDVIRKTVDVAINLIVALDVALKGIDWRTIGDQITQGIIDAIDRIYENRGLIVQTIEDAFAVFNTFINNLINRMIQAGSFRKLGETAGSVILALIEGTANFFTMNTGSIVTGMKQLADELARFIDENEDKIVNGLNTIIDGIVAILRTFLDEKSKLYQKFIDIVEQLHLEDLISVILRAVIQGIIATLKMNEAIWKNLTDDLDELVDALWQAVKPIFDYVAGKIKNKIKEWLFGKDGSFFGLTFDPSQLLHTFLTQYVSPLFNLMPHGEGEGGLFSGWGKKISDFWNNLPWNKDKNAEINLTPTIDGGSLEDFTKNHPVELEFKDANLGKIKATTIEVEIFKGKKLNVEEINAEVLNVVEIFADKLHVGEIDSNTETKKKELDPNYGANDTAVMGTVNNPNGDLYVKNIYAELLDVKKIVTELLEATEIKTELLNAQKIVTDLIDAKKIKTKLLDAKKIITKLLEADKIVTKLIEVKEKILTQEINVEKKITAESLEVNKLDIKEGADGISVSLQDTSSVLNLEGINAGWLNVPTITADLLRVGTIEGNIKGTSGYTPTGIIGVSTGNLPSSYDNMFGVPSIQRPRIEVGDRWSDISGLAPHAEDFLGEVESYWANITDTLGKTVSVTPAVNLAGNDGGYGVVHTLPRNENGSNGNVIPLSDFDKNMSGVVAGAKIKNLPNNADYIRDYLMSFIGNENGVYGLMGNLYAESGLLSNNLQDIKKGEGVTQRDLDYTKKANSSSSSFINDNKGYGLAQWTTSDRKKAFYDSLNGRSVDDLGAQLEYLKSELMSSQYKGVLDKLRNASTIEDASNAVLYGYEKPADQSASQAELRMAYGQDIAGQLGSYDGTVNIEDEETPKSDGIKGFDEANVIGETGGTGGIFSFLDTLPLQTEYRMAEVYNIIDKWLGRIYKLFKSFTVDGFLEDLLKLNEIGDIFDSTILKELRDVLEEIADLLRKLIEDGIKSVEDTRHLDLNTDAKSQNTRAVEDLTDAIYDWIKCAGDTGHLDNNTVAKSKNTLAVEQLNRTIGSLGTQLINVKCECNCCGNCSGCGGGSSTTTRPNIPSYTPNTQHGTTDTISNPSGGGSTRPTTPTGTTGGGSITPARPTGTTGGGSVTPARPTGITSGGRTGKIVIKQNGKSVPMFINMGGTLVPLTDSSPDYVKQSALSGKYAFLDSTGKSVSSNDQKTLLAYIRNKWGNTKSNTTSGTKPQHYSLKYGDGTEKDVYAIVDGKMELVGDKMSDDVKRNIDKYPLVFADGTPLSEDERRTNLNHAKSEWTKKGYLGGGTDKNNTSKTGLESTTHTVDNAVNLDRNTQTADTGTIKNPSGTKTSGGDNLPATTKTNDTGGKPSNKSSGGSNTGGGSHSDGGSSGSHDETNNGGSGGGNTSGGSDSSNKDDSGIRKSSWGAIMHDGQYEQDGRIYNANGTVFAISHEKMAELEKEHAEEIAKKNQERAEEAKKRAEEANAKKKPFRDDENNQDGVNLANENVDKIRNKAKEFLDNINSNGSDAQKATAKTLYEHLMGNYTYGAGDWKDGSSPSTIMVDDIPIPVNGGYYQQEYYKLKNLSDQINALKPTDKDKSLSELSSALGQIDVGDRTWKFSTGGTWYTSTKNSPDPQHKRQGRMDKLGSKFTNFEFEFTADDAQKAGFNSVKEMFDALSKAGANIYSKSGTTLYETYKSNVLQLKSTQMAGLFDKLKSRYMAKGYQMGGIPNAGEIFVARENGTPEFVGSFGNKTVVANNDQIVTAVANGVAMANDSLRSAIENQTNALENAIDRKNLDVNIGDRQIAEANRRGEKDLGQNFIG